MHNELNSNINGNNSNTFNTDFSNLSSMDNSTNFNGEFGNTSVIDNRINELKKQYDDLKKWDDNDWYYNELKRIQKMEVEKVANSNWKHANWIPGIGNLAYGVKLADVATKAHEKHKSNYDNAKKLQDSLFKQIQDAEAQKVSYLANIQAQRDKYKNELKSLESVGVKNPYFILKNGVLGSSSSYSLSNMGSANFSGFSKPGEFDKETLLKILIALIGAGSKLGAAFA